MAVAGLIWMFHAEIAACLDSVKAIGRSGTDEDKITGLMVLAFAGVVLVAIVRILADANRRE